MWELIVVVRCKSCGGEDCRVFCSEYRSRFRFPKTGEEESKLLQGSIPKSAAYKTKSAIKIFREWQINRKVKVPVLEAGGDFKDYGDLFKVQSLSTDLANMDANALNYWLSKFVQEVAKSEGKVYPARTFMELSVASKGI